MPPTHIARSRHADRQPDPRNSAAPSRSHHGGLAAWPARQWQRCGRLLQCRILRAAEAVRRMAGGLDQGEADRRTAGRIRQRIRRHRLQFLAIYPGQCRGRTVGRQRRQLGQDHRARSRDPGADRQGGDARNGAGAGHHRPRRVLGARPAQSEHHGRSREGGALRAERQRRQQCRAGRAWAATVATTLLEADRQFGVVVRLAPEFRNNIDEVRNLKVGVQTPTRQRLYSAERARHDHARHRRLLYLPRAQPALCADQIQRARPRPRRRGRGSAAAHQPTTSSCRPAIGSIGPASSNGCNRPRSGSRSSCRSRSC